MEFHKACKAANLNILPLHTVFLSAGWTEENCREMYKEEGEWIKKAKEDLRTHPDWAKTIRGDPRFARLLDKDAVIPTVKLLFAPDSAS